MDTNIKKSEVLGPGCARSQGSFRVVRYAADQAGLTCELVKVADNTPMMTLGIMATSAIAIEAEVKPPAALRATRRSRSGSPRLAQGSDLRLGHWQ